MPVTPPAAPTHDSGQKWIVWLTTGLITAFAALWRLVELGRPGRLVFDETYYVKQAFSLLRLGYEGHWGEGADENFAAGVFTDLSPVADYVVHPPVGKWMIAVGMAFFDPSDPVGWRISAAITGAVSVGLVVLIARHLYGHILYGAVAGLLLAVDGIHVVMSRISILDIFLSFWVITGFGALLLDRRRPEGARRWWLVVAGVCLGLATGVKWSGLYFVAVFGVVAVAWDLSARRSRGESRWLAKGVFLDGPDAFLALVPTAALTYLATWIPWLTTPGAYMRLAGQNRFLGLWEYHVKMWGFHTSLTSEHTYMSSPLGWLVQARPTSFAWERVEGGAGLPLCGGQDCASAIVALGNPVIWWVGVLTLPVVMWGAVRLRDWRAWAILAGYLAGYAPWFIHLNRTVFTFYTVVFVPFVVLAITYAIRVVTSPPGKATPRRRGILLGAGVVAWALLVGAYFWPVWTAKWVPYWFWQAHMFFPSWI